jgi:hypothetical protein
MSRFLVVINSTVDRVRAAKALASAPFGPRVEFKAAKRSLPQNDRMWAMLSDVAQQKQHAGRKYTADQWKVLFMHACGREVQFIPSLDNSTFIPWGQSSSDLGKDEMSNLIDFIAAWGAENGVTFHDQDSVSSRHSPPVETRPAASGPTQSPAAGNYSREVA